MQTDARRAQGRAGCRRTRRATFRSRARRRRPLGRCSDGKRTPGKVAIFATCYVNYNEPGIGPRPRSRSSSTTRSRTCWSRRKPAAACRSSSSATSRRCEALKDVEHPGARAAGARGLRHPDAGAVVHADVQAGAAADVSRGRRTCSASRDAMFDPFEYLVLRDKDGLLKTDFKHAARQGQLSHSLPLARAEHRPEDARRAGMVPGTTVNTIERCSGHDGTWGVKTRVLRRRR